MLRENFVAAIFYSLSSCSILVKSCFPGEYHLEEGMATTNGESNRPRSMNQSEAVSRRSNIDCIKSIPRQTKTTVETNVLIWARNQVDSTSLSAENDGSSCHPRQSDQYSYWGVQKNESKNVRHTVESARECSASQNRHLAWAWSEVEQYKRPNTVRELRLFSLRNKCLNHPLAFLLQSNFFLSRSKVCCPQWTYLTDCLCMIENHKLENVEIFLMLDGEKVNFLISHLALPLARSV